jgi:hypothetical protein
LPFYEIIYETGNKSVAEYADDEEAISATQAHHERAIKGLPGRGKSTPRADLGDGAPQVMDYPAERISKVLRYEKHPASLNEDMTMSADVARSEFENMIGDSKVVNLMELSGKLRDLANPLTVAAQNGEHDRHASQFKMKEDGEVELPFLKGGE